MLYYFKSTNDLQPRGSFFLDGCVVTQQVSKKPGFYYFTISHPGHRSVVHLSGKNEDDVKEWVATLTAAASGATKHVLAKADSSYLTVNAASLQEHERQALETHSEEEEEGKSRGSDSNNNSPHASPRRNPERDRPPVVPGSAGLDPAGGVEAGLDEGLRARVAAAVAELLFEADDQTGWVANGEKAGVQCFVRRDDVVGARGVGVIAAHPRLVLDSLVNIKTKHEVDPQLKFGRRVEVLSPHTYCDYLQYKAVWPTAARDFMNLVHWRVLPDGSVALVGVAHPHRDVPEVDGIVRGECLMGGWLLRPRQLPGGVQGCDAVFVVKTDLKGSIPAFVVKTVTAVQPMQVATMHTALSALPQAAAVALGPLRNLRATAPEGLVCPVHGEPLPAGIEVAPLDTAAPAPAPAPAAPAAAAAPAAPKPAPAAATATATPAPATASPAAARKSRGPQPVQPASLPALLAAALPVAGAALALGWAQDGQLTAPTWTGVAALLLLLAAGWRWIDVWMGGSWSSTRRKLMIASWSAPAEGNIQGLLEIDVGPALEWAQRFKESTGTKLTVTHLAIKALGLALASEPGVNGHLFMGRYYPAASVDMGCLVAIGEGEDLGNVKICNVDKKSMAEIAAELAGGAGKLRAGKDEDFEKAKGALQALPTFLLRPLVHATGWLGCAAGLNVPPLGVRAYPFGSCVVTSVGGLGLDTVYAPFTPWVHVPVLFALGAVRKKVVAGPDDTPVVRPILTITATVDHRFMDGATGGKVAKVIRHAFANPEETFGRLN